MSLSNIIYYGFLGLLGSLAILLIISALPNVGNYKVKIVQSGSMEPAIKAGSIVVVRPADEYRIGDVITFSGPRVNLLITHRLHEIKIVNGEPRYITKGDANKAPDAREVRKDEVIGKVFFALPYLGYAVEFVKKPVGFVLMVVIPTVIIISDEIKKIYAEIKKKKTV